MVGTTGTVCHGIGGDIVDCAVEGEKNGKERVGAGVGEKLGISEDCGSSLWEEEEVLSFWR